LNARNENRIKMQKWYTNTSNIKTTKNRLAISYAFTVFDALNAVKIQTRIRIVSSPTNSSLFWKGSKFGLTFSRKAMYTSWVTKNKGILSPGHSVLSKISKEIAPRR
jgi:hypothetical protein